MISSQDTLHRIAAIFFTLTIIQGSSRTFHWLDLLLDRPRFKSGS